MVISRTGSTNAIYGFASSYSGALQSGQPDSVHGANTASNSGTNYTDNTTVVATGCWLAAVVLDDDNNISAGSNTIKRGAGARRAFFDSNATVGTGAQTLNITCTNLDRLTDVTISIAPAGNVGSALLLGVGT